MQRVKEQLPIKEDARLGFQPRDLFESQTLLFYVLESARSQRCFLDFSSDCAIYILYRPVEKTRGFFFCPANGLPAWLMKLLVVIFGQKC